MYHETFALVLGQFHGLLLDLLKMQGSETISSLPLSGIRLLLLICLGDLSNLINSCLLALCTNEGRVKVYRMPFREFRVEWVEVCTGKHADIFFCYRNLSFVCCYSLLPLNLIGNGYI